MKEGASHFSSGDTAMRRTFDGNIDGDVTIMVIVVVVVVVVVVRGGGSNCTRPVPSRLLHTKARYSTGARARTSTEAALHRKEAHNSNSTKTRARTGTVNRVSTRTRASSRAGNSTRTRASSRAGNSTKTRARPATAHALAAVTVTFMTDAAVADVAIIVVHISVVVVVVAAIIVADAIFLKRNSLDDRHSRMFQHIRDLNHMTRLLR